MLRFIQRLLCGVFGHDWWKSPSGTMRFCRCCARSQTKLKFTGDTLTADDEPKWQDITPHAG
jgi:hypothetical protein